ncbi:MAG: 3'-5' exonuclease [Verrucomicrobiota bacterium]
MSRSVHPSQPAREATLVAIDFESTGSVEGYPIEPWQIGMVKLEQGTVVIEAGFNRLLRVGDRPFSPYAPGTHHQRRDEIAAASTLQELWPELKTWWLGHAMVAHNASTETKFIKEAAPLHRIGPWIDTLKIARCLYPDQESHKLEDLLSAFNLATRVNTLCPDLEPHDAFYDAVGCAVLLEHFLTLDACANLTVEQLAGLHPRTWHRMVRERGVQYRVGTSKASNKKAQ